MIKKLNLEFSSKSMVDEFGRVFFLNEKVYRVISPKHEKNCSEMLNSNLFKELFEMGYLPKTTISNIKIEGFNLVLEHEKLLEIQQHEWSFDMLKDVTLMVWNFNLICNKYGYELKDAHNLNICFRGTDPVYVDIGSISLREPARKSWIAFNEFLSSLVIPLLFWSKGLLYVSRKLTESNFHRMFTIPAQNFEDSGLLSLINGKSKTYKFSLLNRKIFRTSKKFKLISLSVKIINKVLFKISKRTNLINYDVQYKSLEDFYPFDKIENLIKELKRQNHSSQWKSYHSNYYIKGENIKYSERFERIAYYISQNSEIKSVLDLAGNEGLFSLLLAERLSLDRIIITDYDENALNTAYKNFKGSPHKNVHTALLNFMFTSSLKETALRFNSDLVIALAVSHHLLLTGNFSIGAIFDRLKLYSKKYIMVEFMPLGLWAKGSKTFPEVPSYYTVEWFRQEFLNYFELIIEEKLEENRILFYGYKK
jgi:hypothetical protein